MSRSTLQRCVWTTPHCRSRDVRLAWSQLATWVLLHCVNGALGQVQFTPESAEDDDDSETWLIVGALPWAFAAPTCTAIVS